jgi:hypothetical protein
VAAPRGWSGTSSALIIVGLIPLALRGVRYPEDKADLYKSGARVVVGGRPDGVRNELVTGLDVCRHVAHDSVNRLTSIV